jgi:predicted flap endonuclease-1-like 5' DNA nuclease
MAKLENIEGVGESYAHKLDDGGITSTDELLRKGASAEGRRGVAEKTGISETLILRWVNQVDLARIKGVSEEYGELLEVSGVDSVPELARRNPEHLHESLVKVNQAKHLVRKLPTQNQINDWINQAKTLPRVVTQ